MSYGVASVWNHFSVRETKQAAELFNNDTLPWLTVDNQHNLGKNDKANTTQCDANKQESNRAAATISQAVKDTTEQWMILLKDERVQPVVIMNGFYMLALSGTQFTLLPFLLTGGAITTSSSSLVATAGLALSATAVGQIYMWMSAVQVLGNPIAGRFADRVGKSAGIIAGGTLTSAGMAAVPLVCAYSLASDPSLASDAINWPLLMGTLGVWSLGGTLLATSHVAAVSDLVQDSSRSQAIALLRTAGDVGYLCGAMGAGLTADLAGDVGVAMQVGSAILIGSTAWFGLKTLALQRLEDKSSKSN